MGPHFLLVIGHSALIGLMDSYLSCLVILQLLLHLALLVTLALRLDVVLKLSLSGALLCLIVHSFDLGFQTHVAHTGSIGLDAEALSNRREVKLYMDNAR